MEEQKFLEYEREMQKLKKQYEEEYLSKCQMEADFQNLKKQYEAEVSKVNQQVSYTYHWINFKFRNHKCHSYHDCWNLVSRAPTWVT